MIERELKSLQLRQKDHEMMINSYRENIQELERERAELLDRIDDQDSRRVSDREPVLAGEMLEVKSLMDQVYNLLDERKGESKQLRKKFLASIACLEKALPRR